MYVIGIHDGHNATASLIHNGQIVYVVQEERLTKTKNFDGFPTQSIDLILKKNNLTKNDINYVALAGNHQPKPMTRESRLRSYENLSNVLSRTKQHLKKIDIVRRIQRRENNKKREKNVLQMGFTPDQVRFVEHHLCHAASAYYCSPHENQKTLILTNDGAGDYLCATVSIGEKGKITRVSETVERHSIGLLYSLFTFLTGMVPLEHEYKLMGMAPYADKNGARKIADELHQMFPVSDDGLTWKFNGTTSIYSSLQYFKQFIELKRFDHVMGGLQIFTEEFLTRWVKAAVDKYNINRVALSGGTFMNVKANKVIRELNCVEHIFVFPSCGDESNAIGAALSICNEHLPLTSSRLPAPYWGRAWSDDEILSAFQQDRLQQTYSYQLLTDIEKKVAELLAEGNVVARFKGNEEFGQRSLGNRAILANPYADGVVQEINELIKNRDFWMPFASSILDEDFDKYVQADNKNTPLYMIMTYDTYPAAAEISGGIHPYDKTVRPQLVNNEDNPEYWRLIKEFKNITTIGAVLNTSLNLHGLPIVHTPEDAFHVMENSELKYLAIGNYLFSKEPK